MGKESLIAHVDYATEQIMKDISNNITDSIGDNLQDIKDNTKAITDIYDQTEEIAKKLSGFDGLSSSLTDLKEFANESKMLAGKISPLESQLLNIQNFVEIGTEKNENKVNEVLSGIEALSSTLELEKNSLNGIANTVNSVNIVVNSVKETQTGKFEEITDALHVIDDTNLKNKELIQNSISQAKEDLKTTNDKHVSSLTSSITNLSGVVEKNNNEVGQKISAYHDSVIKTIDENNSAIQNRIENISQKLQQTEGLMQQNTIELNTRIDNLQTELKALSEHNDSQLNVLTESIEKIQVTLDIVVNLTTPFWKKWGKQK